MAKLEIKEKRKKLDALLQEYFAKQYNDRNINSLFSSYKAFYIKYNLPIPKSLELTVYKSVSNLIKNVLYEDTAPIFKRMLPKNNIIKSLYFNNNNLNFIDYGGGVFNGISYSAVEKAMFDAFLESNQEVVQEITGIEFISSIKTDSILTHVRIVFRIGTKLLERVFEITKTELKPTRVLTSIFDKVEPHISELMNVYCEIMENENKKQSERFVIVKGDLINHFYSKSNYIKDYSDASTLHKSCMKSSKATLFYGLFPDEISMLCLFSKRGKLIGRALLWEAYRIDREDFDKTKIGEIIKNSEKTTTVDRIYYNNEETYNLFVAYIKSKGWKSSYNQRGVEKVYSFVNLTIPDRNSLINCLSKIDQKYPYFDSFLGNYVFENMFILHNFIGAGWGDLTLSIKKLLSGVGSLEEYIWTTTAHTSIGRIQDDFIRENNEVDIFKLVNKDVITRQIVNIVNKRIVSTPVTHLSIGDSTVSSEILSISKTLTKEGVLEIFDLLFKEFKKANIPLENNLIKWEDYEEKVLLVRDLYSLSTFEYFMNVCLQGFGFRNTDVVKILTSFKKLFNRELTIPEFRIIVKFIDSITLFREKRLKETDILKIGTNQYSYNLVENKPVDFGKTVIEFNSIKTVKKTAEYTGDIPECLSSFLHPDLKPKNLIDRLNEVVYSKYNDIISPLFRYNSEIRDNCKIIVKEIDKYWAVFIEIAGCIFYTHRVQMNFIMSLQTWLNSELKKLDGEQYAELDKKIAKHVLNNVNFSK
jgi:hypothetical protein